VIGNANQNRYANVLFPRFFDNITKTITIKIRKISITATTEKNRGWDKLNAEAIPIGTDMLFTSIKPIAAQVTVKFSLFWSGCTESSSKP